MKKALLLSLLLVLLISCSEPIRQDRLLMGTNCSVSVFSKSDEKEIESCFEILSGIEKRISSKLADSEIGEINREAGKNSVKVSRETFDLVKRSLELKELTEGAFNPLLGKITSLWNIGSGDEIVPDKQTIDNLVHHLEIGAIVLDEDNLTVYLSDENTALDLGAIGKGYASDVVSSYLKENGIKKALINLGGNVYAIGKKGKDKNWKIGIRNPEGNGLFTTVEIDEGAVITSGSYERYFISDGVRYHHIMDPSTGYPANNDLVSVTIIGRDACLADALSTAVFVLGEEKGIKLLEKLGIRAILLTEDGRTVNV